MATNFWQGVGNWLGNTFGVNQANAAQAGRQQEEAGTGGMASVAKTGQAASNQALQGTQQSLGANAGQTLQRATNAAMPVATQIASQTGNIAGRQAGSAARTAGLNKGQAALQAGQAAGSATAAALPAAEQQQIGNYMGAAQQFQGLQGQTANQALGGYGGQAATGSEFSGAQGDQGQTGAKLVGNILSKFAKGGVATRPGIVGEAGAEVVIPVRKILKVKGRPLEEVLKVIKPELEATTEKPDSEEGVPSMADIIRRLESLEARK